jgi:TRAP-type uncharacterized transport system substrate-binding protein
MYPALVRPSEANYGIVGPSTLLAIDFVLMTNKNVPDDLIYQICKSLYGGKNALTASFRPLGAGFEQSKMAKPLTTGEYHPGAIKFYKEAGLWPPK